MLGERGRPAAGRGGRERRKDKEGLYGEEKRGSTVRRGRERGGGITMKRRKKEAPGLPG